MVSGIAKPEPMLNYLRQTANDVHLLRYPDHHYFTANNLEEIRQTYQNWRVEHKVLVTTEKDAARLAIHPRHPGTVGHTHCRFTYCHAVTAGNGEQFDNQVKVYIIKKKKR